MGNFVAMVHHRPGERRLKESPQAVQMSHDGVGQHELSLLPFQPPLLVPIDPFQLSSGLDRINEENMPLEWRAHSRLLCPNLAALARSQCLVLCWSSHTTKLLPAPLESP